MAMVSLTVRPTLAIDEFPRAHEDNVYRIAIDEDGRHAVSVSGDGHAIVWDVNSSGKLLDLSHNSPVYDASFVVDDHLVTVSGDGFVSWWSRATGKLSRREKDHQNAVYAAAVTPDRLRLTTGGGDTDGGDTVVRIWDVRQASVHKRLPGHLRPVYGLAVSPNGHLVASASSDKTIRLWRDDATEPLVLVGHRSDVYRCDFSRDGQELVTCSQDGTIRRWDVATGRQLTAWTLGRNPVYAVAYSPDNRWIASAADDGHLRIFTAMDGHLRVDEKLSGESLYTIAWLYDSRTLLTAGAAGRIWKYTAPGDPLHNTRNSN